MGQTECLELYRVDIVRRVNILFVEEEISDSVRFLRNLRDGAQQPPVFVKCVFLDTVGRDCLPKEVVIFELHASLMPIESLLFKVLHVRLIKLAPVEGAFLRWEVFIFVPCIAIVDIIIVLDWLLDPFRGCHAGFITFTSLGRYLS